MAPWSTTLKSFFLTVLTSLLVVVFLIRNQERAAEVENLSRTRSSGLNSRSHPIQGESDASQLADLVDSPLALATGVARERIDKMLNMDDPGIVISRPRAPKLTKPKKLKCTSLACGEAGWENDYAVESERRLQENKLGSPGETDASLSSIVSELQAKLESMKNKFRLIRARCAFANFNRSRRYLRFELFTSGSRLGRRRILIFVSIHEDPVV